MGPVKVVSVWCLCLCLLSPPGDILLIVADCQAGQPSLSCCTLKCKITISEIENGWLSGSGMGRRSGAHHGCAGGWSSKPTQDTGRAIIRVALVAGAAQSEAVVSLL